MGVGCPPSDSDINRKKMVSAVMTCLQRPVPTRVFWACKQISALTVGGSDLERFQSHYSVLQSRVLCGAICLIALIQERSASKQLAPHSPTRDRKPI